MQPVSGINRSRATYLAPTCMLGFARAICSLLMQSFLICAFARAVFFVVVVVVIVFYKSRSNFEILLGVYACYYCVTQSPPRKIVL